MRPYDSDMPGLAEVPANDPDAVADALHEHGACRLTGFPDSRRSLELKADLERLQWSGAMRSAQVGQGHARQRREDIRGDAIIWLDDPRCGAPALAYLQMLDTLRISLNRLLMLGVDEVEAHYACFDPDARYLRHRDRFAGSQSRVLSLVSYLNPDWHADQGGALRLHLPCGPVDILPQLGTGVCFRSEIEHEVLASQRQRLSIAAWMRTRDSRPASS